MSEQLIEEIEQGLIDIDEVDSLEIYPEKQVISWLRTLLEENQNLRFELSAKDKVLEWYANAENYTYQFYYGEDPDDPDELQEPIMLDDGEQARSILSQYKGEDAQ